MQGIFKIALGFRDWQVFTWKSLKILKFSILWIWNNNYEKGKPFSKKLENRFFVESTKIENATFSLKTALSEVNVWLNSGEWGVQNGPIRKNGILPVTTSFFGRFCFSIRTFYKELIWCTNYPSVHIHTFRKRWSFIRGCFLPVSIFK